MINAQAMETKTHDHSTRKSRSDGILEDFGQETRELLDRAKRGRVMGRTRAEISKMLAKADESTVDMNRRLSVYSFYLARRSAHQSWPVLWIGIDIDSNTVAKVGCFNKWAF